MDALRWGILVAARVLPVVLLVPPLGGQRLPVPAKLGLATVISMAVFDCSGFSGSAPEGLLFFGLLLKELSVGAILALAASVAFEGLRMGGQMIDALRGAGSAGALLPHAQEQTTPLGDLHLLLGVLVFFSAGGPVLFFNALRTSFVNLPVNTFPAAVQANAAAELALAVTAQAIRMGVSIAFPAAAALLVADTLLGFMNRSAPQIQIFFLGMPLRAVIGVLAAILALDRSLERFVLALTS